MMKVAKEWYVCSNIYIKQMATWEVSDLTIYSIINTESLRIVLTYLLYLFEHRIVEKNYQQKQESILGLKGNLNLKL